MAIIHGPINNGVLPVFYGGTAATNQNVWYTWAGNVTTTGTSSTVIWSNWVFSDATVTTAGTIRYGNGRVMTDEERAAILAEQQRRQEEYRRQDQERAVAQMEASERATALLHEHLDDAQKAEFAEHRAFTVISADGERTYRIRPGWSRNVDLLRDGQVVRTYCAHPGEQVPHEDNMLAQKLFLESDEQAFLRVAIAS